MTDLDQKSEFEQLLQRNRGRLTAIAHSYAQHDVDDLLQEIMLQIWRSLSTFQGRSSIDTWCYRIALNTAISWRRSGGKRKQKLSMEVADLGQVPSANQECDVADLLQQFLRTLSDTDRALLLMYMDDMSTEEMAQVMGTSEATLRVRIHRIKRRVAEWEAIE